MEHKIGEIFEYNGEWYQCIIGHCNQCSFDEAGTCKFIGNPYCAYRNDKKLACFKKLEKAGEPMKIHNRLVLKVKADAYKCMRCCFYSKGKCELTMQECEHYDCGEENKFIELKQTKEDMEEKKVKLDKLVTDYTSNKITYNEFEKAVKELYADKEESKPSLKSFSLEAAKQGKPVCTRDGRKSRIICFDRICGDDYYKIVACVTAFDGDFEEVLSYGIDGYIVDSQNPKDEDLMMLPEKKEGWVNVYKGGLLGARIYSTKEEAINNSEKRDYIDTIRVEWEEHP